MNRRLIVNADDFGFTVGASRGIVDAFRHGVVRSTSIMANMPAFDESIRLLEPVPELDCGVHLNLTAGSPLLPASDVASLVNRHGRFHSLPGLLARLKLGRVDPPDVDREWRAQLARVRQAGIRPSHIDSHHHVHATAELYDTAVRLAEAHDIPYVRCPWEWPIHPRGLSLRQILRRVAIDVLVFHIGRHRRAVRLAAADHFTGVLFERLLNNPVAWNLELEALPEGTVEVACHPGYGTEALRALESDAEARYRERELALFTQPQLSASLQDHGITVVNHREYCGSRASRCPPASASRTPEP